MIVLLDGKKEKRKRNKYAISQGIFKEVYVEKHCHRSQSWQTPKASCRNCIFSCRKVKKKEVDCQQTIINMVSSIMREWEDNTIKEMLENEEK